MAYAVKYRISYYRKSGGNTTIDILEKDYAGGITTLQAAGNPLEISKESEITNIYKPSIGSGATIRVISPSPLALIDLFTEDPQKFIVKIYNGASGTTLIWQGFVSTGIYNESYSSALPNPVTIYCNDGMEVLSDIAYAESDATHYTGTVTIGTIFTNILEKLAISFTTIYTSNDLEIFDDGDTQITNFFLYLKLPNENYIDESGVAMSCRQVLESIVQGMGGLTIFFNAIGIYIIDPINLHDTAKGKSYTVSPIGGSETVISTLGGYIDISAGDISWGETGSELDILPSVNETIVKYDPYNFNDFSYNFNDAANWDTTGSFEDQTGWYFNYTVEFTGWDNTTNNYHAGIKEQSTDSPIYCLVLSDDGGSHAYDVPYSNITQDQTLQIKLSMDVYVQTRENSMNIWSNAAEHEIYQIKLPISVKVGDQYWDGGNSWSDDESSGGDHMQALIVRQAGISNIMFSGDPTQSKINDVWTNANALIPINQSVSEILIQGDISIEIFDIIIGAFESPVTPWGNKDYVYRVLIANVRVELVKASTGENVGNNGEEYRAGLSSNLIGKKAFEIPTTVGTGVYGCSRGAFKTDQQVVSGTNISGLYRGDLDSNLEIYNTAKLLLQSFSSQYKQPRFVLRAILDVHDYLLSIFFKLIQDTNHLGTKSFYIVNGTYVDREEIMDVECIEVEDERETILDV